MQNVGGNIERTKPSLSYRRPHAYLGPPPGSLAANPSNPLKAGARKQREPTLKELKDKNPSALVPSVPKARVKPALPSRLESPPIAAPTEKNFIVANAVDTILTAPRRRVPAEKDYLAKPDYGQAPKYLSAVKADIAKEYEYIRTLQAAEQEQNKAQVRLLPEEERQNLLIALKKKWQSVNNDYQTMTHMTRLDTVGQIRRKEHYEKLLSEIEKDIAKIDRGFVFIDQQR